MRVRMVGVMQYQISHAASIQSYTAADRSQLQLYDWCPDEISDVPRLIRPTIYEQEFEWFYDCSKLYMKCDNRHRRPGRGMTI